MMMIMIMIMMLRVLIGQTALMVIVLISPKAEVHLRLPGRPLAIVSPPHWGQWRTPWLRPRRPDARRSWLMTSPSLPPPLLTSTPPTPWSPPSVSPASSTRTSWASRAPPPARSASAWTLCRAPPRHRSLVPSTTTSCAPPCPPPTAPPPQPTPSPPLGLPSVWSSPGGGSQRLSHRVTTHNKTIYWQAPGQVPDPVPVKSKKE